MAAESPDLLHDQTMEDMDAPPELGAFEGPPGGTPAAIPGCCPPAMSCLTQVLPLQAELAATNIHGVYTYICSDTRYVYMCSDMMPSQ